MATSQGKFSLKQLFTFVLKKTNILKLDQIEPNTSLQPGARVLYHGTGSLYSGLVYYLSGSEDWAKATYESYDTSGKGKLVAYSLGPEPESSGGSIVGQAVVPATTGMLMRGMCRAIIWGTAEVGAPVFLYSLGFMVTDAVLSFADGVVTKQVGTILKVFTENIEAGPLVSEVLIDFSPDHSFVQTPGDAIPLKWQDDEAVTADSTSVVTAADVLVGIVKCTPTGTRIKPTDTATNFVATLALDRDNKSHDFTFINTATDGSSHVQLTAGTGITLVPGTLVIDAGTSHGNAATFRIRRTSATACTIYRLTGQGAS